VQACRSLLATQLESYTAFLQAHVAPKARRNQGLQAGVHLDFPDLLALRERAARVRELSAGIRRFDVKECQQRGLTYCRPLRAKVRLGHHGQASAQAHGQGR
jgi:DNA-directed RNA polymerase subunit beta